MRGVWVRRFIPASVVAVVLAFSYFAPAIGVDIQPVKSHDNPNCGRYGYGYHGGKHNFVCPTRPPAANPDGGPVHRAVSTQSPIAKSQSPATPAGNSPSTQRPARVTGPVAAPAPVPAPATKKVVVEVPVSVGVSQWKGFTDLVLHQLS